MEPLERLSQKYWFNPIAIFATHYNIWTVIEPFGTKLAPYSTKVPPFTGNIRPSFVAWFIMPLVVYLYQNVILQHVAKRRLLEPLNYRGQPSWPFGSGERNIRHRIESAMVAHWHIILFGPVLDGLFWIILAGFVRHSPKYFGFKLLVTIVMVTRWYVCLGTEDPNVVSGRHARRFYFLIIVLCFATLVYEWHITGSTWNMLGEILGLLSKVFLGIAIPFAIRMARRTKSEANHQWSQVRNELRSRWDEIQHRWTQVFHR